MPYDQFGRPIPGGAPTHEPHYNYGQAESGHGYGDASGMGGGPHEGYRQALLAMPSAGQLGGPGPVPFVRYPFFPTAPFYSTNPNVGYQTRFYSTGVQYTDADYTVGSEMIRTIQFDIPCRLVAFNGSALYYFGSPAVPAALPLGVKPNDTYLFRGEYTTGDKLHIAARLGSTVVGSDENPGEIGGTGYTIDAGASFVIGITPLIANLRIDVTLVCLEMRGPRNFSR
jgi:hypothetical protein